MLSGIEKIFADDPPGTVLVQGDTNTGLAGSLVASTIPARLGHVEAGLRSYDRTMPEEVNRVVSDHLSDLLFAPTATARKNLMREGIDPSTVHVTGNTVVDALYAHRRAFGSALLLPAFRSILQTYHRPMPRKTSTTPSVWGLLPAMGTLASGPGTEVSFPRIPYREG
jgi:UDP-N-acetylglucosamine 2-epimerase